MSGCNLVASGPSSCLYSPKCVEAPKRVEEAFCRLLHLWAGSAVEDVGEGAGSAVEDVGEGAGQAVESTGEAIEDVCEGAGSAVEDMSEGSGYAAGEVGPYTVDEDDSKQPKATTAAKRKAEELGIDLSQIQKSGSGGTITTQDVVSTPKRED